jgi:hypothetical protein
MQAMTTEDSQKISELQNQHGRALHAILIEKCRCSGGEKGSTQGWSM